ncbi:8876_t:CDS:2, partial [Cetraspora pellucida]
IDNLDFFNVDNNFGVNNNKSFMNVNMNYNKSFISVDMTDNKISEDFYNDERMDDNNKSELGDHEEHEKNIRFAYPLVKSQVFESWKAIDYENDKSDETPWRHVYMCTKGQRYMPHKEAHILVEINNQIRISSIVSTHNHEMIQNITMVESRYSRLTKEMKDNVRLLTSCSFRAGSIIEVLQQKNPEKYIHARNIANEVSTGMFTNNMFDAFIIELEELISDLDHKHIYKIWKVSSIDAKS